MLASAADSCSISVSSFPRLLYRALLFFGSAELKYEWMIPLFLAHIFIFLTTRTASHATGCNEAR